MAPCSIPTSRLLRPGSCLKKFDNTGCSKIVGSSHPQKVPRRRSSATPHKVTFEDGGEMAVFQQPPKKGPHAFPLATQLRPDQIHRLQQNEGERQVSPRPDAGADASLQPRLLGVRPDP